MTNLTTIGLDIAKNTFTAHGFDDCGKTVLRKELKRGQVLAFFAKGFGAFNSGWGFGDTFNSGKVKCTFTEIAPGRWPAPRPCQIFGDGTE